MQPSGDSSSGSDSLIGAIPSDFHRCFCWDQTKGDMCGGADFFNSQPCQDWLVNHFWWVPVALVAMVVLVAFPAIFYCARCCCNCCGGRHASYGCCCPTEVGRQAFPGYSNTSIVVTKFMFLLCLGLGIAFSVCGLSHNSMLDGQVITTANTFDSAVLSVKMDLVNVQSNIANTQFQAPYFTNFVPTRIQTGVQNAISSFGWRADQVHDNVHDVKNAENHARNTLSKIVLIEGLVLLGVGFFLCVFSGRKLVGIVMVGFCLHIAMAILVLAPHQILRIASNSVCDNFDSTIVPLTTGALQTVGVCNNAEVALGMTELAGSFQAYVTDGSQMFCQDYNNACQAAGNAVCWQTPCSGNQPFPNMNVVSVSRTDVNSALNTISSLVNLVSQYDSTYRLNNFITQQTMSLPQIQQFASQIATSGYVTNLLQNTIRPVVCGDDQLQGKVSKISGDLTVLVGSGLATIVVLILAMKRFRRMGSYAANTLYAVVEEQQPIINVTATRVAIIGKVCTADDTVLSPYAASNTQGYPAEYGATASTNEYRTI